MPSNQFTLGRRRFLAATAASAMASTLLRPQQATAEDASSKNKICVFTKPFNSLSFDELADKIAELGFDGIEAPIRKGGHIETQAIADELPKLVDALQKRNLEITLATSDINDPDDPLTQKFLRTLGTLGIQRYRMKYFHYDFDLSLEEQWQEWRPKLKQLAAMNHEYGVQGLYQNHAGTKYLGASIWDLREVMGDIEPTDLGVAFDIRHATAEGTSTWPVAFRAIQPNLGMVYVKDFAIQNKKVTNVPLGEGYVDKSFFKMLAKTGYAGPISLHEEYLDHRDPDLVPAHLAAIKKDLAVLRGWLR
ncbi:sugar phosphate isomerase/epimerase family protein [Planctomycetes bacterium K23_9]|uniref:Xylose isomerase-like TIM barrel n=1 Tax=Stieleria marina TaxID=1930275 RepID=A0A517P3A1_9BACT|nr:Xylose isomerase-like TIM barrel [Planctomycetes bacterium K23_9]